MQAADAGLRPPEYPRPPPLPVHVEKTLHYPAPDSLKKHSIIHFTGVCEKLVLSEPLPCNPAA